MKIIVFICSIFFISCTVKKNFSDRDINASADTFYYKPMGDTKFLYKKKLYPQEEFTKKYNILDFKHFEVIQDKDKVWNLTKDDNCKVIIHIIE